jgi:hypothetical protein
VKAKRGRRVGRRKRKGAARCRVWEREEVRIPPPTLGGVYQGRVRRPALIHFDEWTDMDAVKTLVYFLPAKAFGGGLTLL